MGSDLLVCGVCGYQARDLQWHVRKEHRMSGADYKKLHGNLVAPEVLAKRRSTCLARHGDEHFTNRPAAALTNMTFEGGHSLRDPAVRAKADKTKIKLYGDAGYTNREKAKRTCIERYGVSSTGAVPSLIEKRVATLKRKYGRVFNVDRPHNKREMPEGFRTDYLAGMHGDELRAKYGVSHPVIKRWSSEASLKRSRLVTSRVCESPQEVTAKYLEACGKQGKTLSFYDYGKIHGTARMTKIKRLFNAGGKFHSLRHCLFDAATHPELAAKLYQDMS